MGLLAEHYSYLAWRFRPDKLEGLWRRCKSLFPFLGVRVFFISLGYFLKCYNFPRCVSQRVFFCISERYLCMTFNVFSRFLLLFFSFSLFTFFFFLYIFLTFFFFLYIFLFPSISFLFFPDLPYCSLHALSTDNSCNWSTNSTPNLDFYISLWCYPSRLHIFSIII